VHTFTAQDYWKALILFGLNQATYKIALGKSLLTLASREQSKITWEQLSEEFLNQYQARLAVAEPMPQQGNPSRRTAMEHIVLATQQGMNRDKAIVEVGEKAFNDVIQRFHNLGFQDSLQGKFYRYKFGSYLELTDELLSIAASDSRQLTVELDARWGLLEGAFAMASGADFALVNDIRVIYLASGTRRTNLTSNIPFLQGYQGNVCFYCGAPIEAGDCHVDHLLPRQVLRHDELWNLVLAHSLCNAQKLDRLVGPHFIAKLISRNENIMGSNHPWKKKIVEALGTTPQARAKKIHWHYDNVKVVVGATNYWGGSDSYNPSTDPFLKADYGIE